MLTLKLSRPGVDVSVESAPGSTVIVVLEPRECETFDDQVVQRSITPVEAREWAAALVHAASEAERS